MKTVYKREETFTAVRVGHEGILQYPVSVSSHYEWNSIDDAYHIITIVRFGSHRLDTVSSHISTTMGDLRSQITYQENRLLGIAREELPRTIDAPGFHGLIRIPFGAKAFYIDGHKSSQEEWERHIEGV